MKLTIFTPTYNRAELLKRVYESISNQITDGVEWLIVNEGFKDSTELSARSLIDKASFPIRYIKKENGGKHTAHNTAVEEAHGEWFMCLDSDDLLSDGALQNILSILPTCTGNVCAVAAYKRDLDGNLLCDKFEDEQPINGIYTLLGKYHGEYVFLFRTDKIKKYPYPTIEGERFISECLLYDRLELEGYSVLPFDKVIQECEYQAEGLSLAYKKLLKNNPCGVQMFYNQRIDLAETFKKRFICCIKYCAFRILGKFKAPKYKGKYSAFIFLSYPFGMLATVYYLIRLGGKTGFVRTEKGR